MSLFDELFESAAAPILMTQFADERSVSIELDGVRIVTNASAVVRAERTVEEYEDERIVKRIEMDIDLLRDELALPDKGLERNLTSGKAIVNGVRWNVDGMENRTATFVTLKLFRKVVRETSTSGFRRQEG